MENQAGRHIKVSAGTKGEVDGNMTVVGLSRGGAANNVTDRSPSKAMRTDLSNVSVDVQGPTGDLRVGGDTMVAGVVEGGVNSTVINEPSRDPGVIFTALPSSSTEHLEITTVRGADTEKLAVTVSADENSSTVTSAISDNTLPSNIRVVGMGGGDAKKSSVAGVVQGGMGNKGTHYYDNRKTRNIIKGSQGVVTAGDFHGTTIQAYGGVVTTLSHNEPRKPGQTSKRGTVTNTVTGSHGVITAGHIDGGNITLSTVTGSRNKIPSYRIGAMGQQVVSGHSPGKQERDLNDITESEVIELLKKHGLEQYVDKFQEHHIDGSLLAILEDDDLVDMGVDKGLERKKILNLKKHLPPT